MAWDGDKSDFETLDDVPDDKKLTAAEWNEHVADQKGHGDRHEFGGIDEIAVDGLTGDLADPQDPKEEAVQDFVDALLAGGDKITTTYDDANGTLTIDTSALDTEEVEDAIDATLTGGPQVTTTYDDGAGTLTISIDAPTQAAFDDHSTRHESGGVDELSVDGLPGVLAEAQTPQTEAVEDIVGALITGGTNVTVSYDDANDVLTVDTSALDEEEVEDAVAALVTAGNAITVNYDDPNDALSIGVDESALSFYDGSSLTAPIDSASGSIDDLDGTSLQYETVAEDYHYAGSFDGADADARLDAALTKAIDDDRIILESADYSANRTISQRVVIEGVGIQDVGTGSYITGDWTFEKDGIKIMNARNDGAMTVTTRAQVMNCGTTGSITVTGDEVLLVGLTNLSVTFQSGTSGGIVDASTDVGVTDNGTNTIGDIA